MKTEHIVTLDESYDYTELLEPLWYVEAASLIQRLICNETLEVKRAYGLNSLFANKLSAYKQFEQKVLTRGRQILEGSPQLSRYPMECREDSAFFKILYISLFMYYRTLGLLDDPIQFKRRFFMSLFAEFDEARNDNLEDFAEYYKAAVKEVEQEKDLMVLLDFHMHFEKRFEELSEVLIKLADMIQQEAQAIRFLWEHMTASQLIDQTNELMAGHVSTSSYTVRHVFPGLIYPNGTGLRDNQLGHPLLIVGILSYDILQLPEKTHSLEWKTTLLKLLGDPVRYQILLKSKERPVYLSELARELDLKPSTLSHHLNALNNEKLIVWDVSDSESRRQYYSLNRETVAELLAELNELL